MPGDRITLIEAGGGGFGSPKDRSLELIRSDVHEGFVSSAAVIREYQQEI